MTRYFNRSTTESDKWKQQHIECPMCPSSDGFCIDRKDWGYCFSCGEQKYMGDTPYNSNNNDSREESNTLTIEQQQLIIGGYHRDLDGDQTESPLIQRGGISKFSCEFFDVRCKNTEEKTPAMVILPYYDKNGILVAQKVRTEANPKGIWLGSPKDAVLFGSNKFKGGNRITITEGELDALAYRDLMGDYPVVSIKNGAQAAVSDIRKNFEFFNSFNAVYICFDNDDPGRAAAEKVAQLFPIGKAKIVSLRHHNDVNDYLKHNDKEAFKRCWWDAKDYTPAGIEAATEGGFDSLFDEYDSMDLYPYPFDGINAYTFGKRRGELTTVVAGCVDADTEFLTPTGWKRIADYEDGDEVAAYDKFSKEISFEKPKEFIKKPCNLLWRIQTKYGIDQVLSDEHRIFYETANGVQKVNTLAEVKEIHDLQTTGFRGQILTTFRKSKGLHEKDTPLGRGSKLSIMIAAVADGHFPNKNGTKCYMRLKKDRKKERLTKLLDHSGIPYTRKPCAPFDGFEVFIFNAPFKMKDFSHEYWWNMTPLQLEEFREEVLFWDGDQKKRFFTRIPVSADFVQYAFSASGKNRASISYYDRKEGGVDIAVTVSENTKVSFRKTLTSKPKFEKFIPKDGFKYCFSVSTGLLVLRREGNIFITGNSGVGKSAGIREFIFRDLMETDEKIGVIMLEESTKKTKLSLMSLFLNRPLHLTLLGKLAKKFPFIERALEKRFSNPDVWKFDDKETKEQLKEAWEHVIEKKAKDGSNKLWLFNHFGSNNIDKIVSSVDAMVTGLGCRLIYLDHISMVVSDQQNGDERKALDELATKLRTLIEQKDFSMTIISHLRRPGGKPHEEGGETSLADIRGTAGIGQLSDIVMGFERNQQHEDPVLRNVTTIRILKNRFEGSTGPCAYLQYNPETGRLVELDGDEYKDLLEEYESNKRTKFNDDESGETTYEYDNSIFDSTSFGEQLEKREEKD